MTTSRASKAEITELWQRFKANPRDRGLRNALVEHFLPLVKLHAKKLWARLPGGVEIDDLVSAGVFGLVDAIDAFDLSRDIRFETYCAMRIRGAMVDELRKMDWVPRLVRSKATKLAEATKRLTNRHGREPTHEELADLMEVSVSELETTIRESQAVGVISLNRQRYDSDSVKDVEEINSHEDRKSENPTRGTERKDLMRLVTRGLNQNERLIVLLYYYEELTMKEIGETLCLSESRVSQMHSSILDRLRFQLKSRRSELQLSRVA